MVLQKFDIEMVNPGYELSLTGQMGVKPVDFKSASVVAQIGP